MHAYVLQSKMDGLKESLTLLDWTVEYVSLGYWNMKWGDPHWSVRISCKGRPDETFDADTAEEAVTKAEEWAAVQWNRDEQIESILGVAL